MRIINSGQLPPNYRNSTLIKSVYLKRHYQMSLALERTLAHCSKIHAEYESNTVKVRKSAEQEGFSTGFRLFFHQLIAMLEKYEKCQNDRFTELQQSMIIQIKESLTDPVIVERVVHHLQEKCGHQKPLRIIIPKAVRFPAGADISNYQFCDDNDITIQNDADSIRFPTDSLCQQWISHADDKLVPTQNHIVMLAPELCDDIIKQLIDFKDRNTSNNESD